MSGEITHGEMRQRLGLSSECDGGEHVIPIPDWHTAETVIEELRVFGKLVKADENPRWTNVTCLGKADCWCQFAYLAPDFVWLHNDVTIWPISEEPTQ